MITENEPLPNPESLAYAANAVRLGLIHAHNVHNRLGEQGLEAVHTNSGGDIAMLGDIEAERALIETLSAIEGHVLVHSEEHGTFSIHDDGKPAVLTAVMDGIDGSEIYKKERGKGKYATLFTLLEGDNPKYNDYLAGGAMEHGSSKLVLAVKGWGLEVINLLAKTSTHPRTNNHDTINSDSVIFVDSLKGENPYPNYADYFELNSTTFTKPLNRAGYSTVRLGSTGAHYVSVATGEGDIWAESTRKGNMEHPTAYALMQESGGVMMDLAGQDVGPYLFSEFGQTEFTPVFGASSSKIAKQFLDIIARNT